MLRIVFVTRISSAFTSWARLIRPFLFNSHYLPTTSIQPTHHCKFESKNVTSAFIHIQSTDNMRKHLEINSFLSSFLLYAHHLHSAHSSYIVHLIQIHRKYIPPKRQSYQINARTVCSYLRKYHIDFGWAVFNGKLDIMSRYSSSTLNQFCFAQNWHIPSQWGLTSPSKTGRKSGQFWGKTSGLNESPIHHMRTWLFWKVKNPNFADPKTIHGKFCARVESVIRKIPVGRSSRYKVFKVRCISIWQLKICISITSGQNVCKLCHVCYISLMSGIRHGNCNSCNQSFIKFGDLKGKKTKDSLRM